MIGNDFWGKDSGYIKGVRLSHILELCKELRGIFNDNYALYNRLATEYKELYKEEPKEEKQEEKKEQKGEDVQIQDKFICTMCGKVVEGCPADS